MTAQMILFLVVLGATLISSLSIFRKLGKLDLVTALKYKE